MDASTRTTLFGLFVIAGRPLTARMAIALAAPLGVSATNVKSHLTRLVAEGALVRKGPVRKATYEPSRRQRAVIDGVNLRFAPKSRARWNGRWVVATLGQDDRVDDRSEASAALWFDGFRPLAPGVHARPDWPRGWALDRARFHAGASGFSLTAKPSPESEERLEALYDLAALDAEACALAADLDARRRETDPARAFAARLAAGGDVARLLGHDPYLPAELWGEKRGFERLAAAYRRLDAEISPAAQQFLASILEDQQ